MANNSRPPSYCMLVYICKRRLYTSLQAQLQSPHHLLHSPGSHRQVCLSHWSEQRLWAGQGDERQGLPTLQPVSTLTALEGRGRAGASGLTPNRTPCRKRKWGSRYLNTTHKNNSSCISVFTGLSQSHFLLLVFIFTVWVKNSILYLYASSYPVLNLPRSQHSSNMQMFHLQTMNLISHYHCSLMGKEGKRWGNRWRQERKRIWLLIAANTLSNEG